MVRIRVPATSANLGPGFDCLGLAVGLYLEVRAAPAPRDDFVYRGGGAPPAAAGNLVHEGFRAACAEAEREPPPVRLEAMNPIPLARGLGSSSAALVAGAAAADALLGLGLGRDGVFALTARMEGHPDNVAPAVYGGFTVAAETTEGEGRYLVRSLPLPPRWRLLFGVPAFELPTAEARRALPDRYDRKDAVTTAARAALWALAVARDEPELLRLASRDVLHEPYRAPLVPGLVAAREALQEAGAFGSFLSGAGPTLAAVVDDARAEACRAVLEAFTGAGGRVLELPPAPGYEVLPAAVEG